MSVLMVPALDAEPWPTLGPQLAQWLEAYGVYGPGDLAGDPYKVDPMFGAWLCRAYEVFPRGHPRAGRRRFSSAVLSERKGLAKTEKLAMVAFAEGHPDAPVRCDGWDAHGQPVGRGIARDAYCPLVAYTKDQTEELAYGALKAIIGDGPLADQYDIGEERIIHIASRNKVAPLAGSPSARDGARTTWQGFDETHRLYHPRLVKAHQTMMANIPKRMAADAWSMETTTAFEPGEGSIAELTYNYAEQIAAGIHSDPRMFFFHRQADDDETLDLVTPAGVRRAVEQASGPALSWSNVDSIVDLWFDPRTDPAYWKRVWANMVVKGGSAAYDFRRWEQLARPDLEVPAGAPIAITFDGSKTLDTTVMTGITMDTGHLFELGSWERPAHVRDGDGWQVPQLEVDALLDFAWGHYTVVKMRADPWYWEGKLRAWQSVYGADRVESWDTRNHTKMSAACRTFAAELREGTLTHDGAPVTSRHVGQARKRKLPQVDEDGEQLWVLTKDQPMSPRKIDGAVTVTMAVATRLELLAEGWSAEQPAGFALVLGR